MSGEPSRDARAPAGGPEPSEGAPGRLGDAVDETTDRPGRLLRARVVADAGAALEDALDRRLTGYAVFEPRDALLGAGGGPTALAFEEGIPTLAAHASGRGGPAALGALGAGPYRLELYALAREALGDPQATPERRVPPAMAAERLAGDEALAARTRTLAPAGAEAEATPSDRSAVEAFLADEERIAAIRERAREQARRRAAEWGFADAV